MTTTEFVELVRKMRTAQKVYNKLHPHLEREKKLKQMIIARQLESQVDKAASQFQDGGMVPESPIA